MHAQLDGMHTRGGDSIKHKKRLLITAAVGAAFVLSVVLIVSLGGDDKPGIETNPPPADEQPDTPQTPSDDGTGTVTPNVTPGPDDDDDNGVDKPKPKPKPDNGGGNGNGNDDGSDSPTEDEKKHGLERAIEVHLRNMEKQADKKGGSDKAGSSPDDGKGLENSLMHLQKNLEKQNASMGDVSEEDLDNGHGQGKAKGNPNNA